MKGAECVSTLLERAKGSVLDIVAHHHFPATSITLISPRAQQIRYLEFTGCQWEDIIAFSESISGRLSLLHILKIDTHVVHTPRLRLGIVTPPSLFFGGSTNLGQFTFRSRVLSFLSRFTFPNLTVFELSAYPEGECSASYLLDFLKASPTLQTVELMIPPTVVLRGVPREMVVVLSDVKSFSLRVTRDPTTHVYDIAAHISCPRARDASLAHGVDNVHVNDRMKIFPTPDSWNVIAHQYTASPIEEVTLEITYSELEDIECFLTFRSSSMSVLRSGFKVIETGVDEGELDIPRAHIGWEIFYQALTTIQDCPLLSHVKRLYIEYTAAIPAIYTYGTLRIGSRIRELFSSLGPLDELTIHGCDLRIFLAEFVEDLRYYNWMQPVVFPQVKELAILHPVMKDDVEECMDAIVGLAKSQHSLGIPFERLTVHMWDIPARIEEELMRWVDTVDCDGSGECCHYEVVN